MYKYRRTWAEENWCPNQDKPDREASHAGSYHAYRMWDTDEIMNIPPMCYTDKPSSHNHYRDTLQIFSIKIASIRGGLRWPLDVFGMVTARDVLDDCKRIIIYARARSNCQTIMEEHPYLELTGPTRAVRTCIDSGNIEIILKVKGATEAEDRDLSFLVLTLQGPHYISYNDDYTSKRSTLQCAFHHIEDSVEATIGVRLIGRSSSPPSGFQGVITASTSNIDELEVLLLAFRDGKLPIADDGTIKLSRRVVSVGFRNGEELKVSIVAQCEENEQETARHDIVFIPKYAGRSCGVLNVGACKMQVTVAWSEFEY